MYNLRYDFSKLYSSFYYATETQAKIENAIFRHELHFIFYLHCLTGIPRLPYYKERSNHATSAYCYEKCVLLSIIKSNDSLVLTITTIKKHPLSILNKDFLKSGHLNSVMS